MILIADSGSTKTDWRLISGKEIRSMSTRGINPFFSSAKEIKEELEKLDFQGNEPNIHEIYFYGSGVANKEMKDVIHQALQTRIGVHPYIQVHDDLIGVARALFQDRSGIACILGVIGFTLQSDLLSLGTVLGGVLFWLALFPMTYGFFRSKDA